MSNRTIDRRKEPEKFITGRSFNKFSDDPLSWMDFDFVHPGRITPFNIDFWLKEMECSDFYFNLDDLAPYFTPPKKCSGLTGTYYDHSERLAPFITTDIEVDNFSWGGFVSQDVEDALSFGLAAAGVAYTAPILKGGLKALSGTSIKGLLKSAGWWGILVSVAVPLVKWMTRGDYSVKLDTMLKAFIASTVGARDNKYLRKISKSRDYLTPFELSIICTLQQFGFSFVDNDCKFIAVIYDHKALEEAETLTEMNDACALFVLGSKTGTGGNGGKYF